MRLPALVIAVLLPACSATSTRYRGTAVAADIAAAGSAALIINASTCDTTHHTEEGWFGEERQVSDYNCVGPAAAALFIGVPLGVIAAVLGVQALSGLDQPPPPPPQLPSPTPQ
jgi:hypothetical protein